MQTIAGVLTPSAVQRIPTGDRNLRAERRTYDLADAAGNTLRLVHSVGLTKDDAVAGMHTLQYNGGAVQQAAYNVLFVEWRLKKGAYDSLVQNAFVGSPLQSARAEWTAKDNVTRITSTPGGQTTVPGMFLVRLATNGGAISIETTP